MTSADIKNKSRKGCQACKDKRLKCGEEKPQCFRCIRRGVQCAGYDQSLKWSMKHEVLGDTSSGWQDGRGRRKRFKPNEQDVDSGRLTSSLGVQQSRKDPVCPLYSFESIPDNSATVDSEFEISAFWPDLSDIQDSTLWSPHQLAMFDLSNSVGRNDATGEQDAQQPTTSIVEKPSARINGLSASEWLPTFEGVGETYVADELAGFQFTPTCFSSLNGLVEAPTSYHQHSVSAGASLEVPSPGVPPPGDTALVIPASSAHEELNPTAPLNTVDTISKNPENSSSVLVEFYFKETAQVFSCYDGNLNPFRTTVAQLWNSSPLIYHSLASMAAGSLSANFPRFERLGAEHRHDAINLLRKEDAVNETVLLALLMLGGTASWHDPKDMGVPFFNLVQKHLQAMSQKTSTRRNDNNFRFFQEAMMYWEMLLAFVVDGSELKQSGGSGLPDEVSSTKKVPHPWTGIARETQFLVQSVGRLIRQQRTKAYSCQFATQAYIRQMQQALATAQDLEHKLLALAGHATENDLVNPGDRDTPLWHLVTLAEVYRQTGLIQLYRVFPDLLHSKLEANGPRIVLDHESTSFSMECENSVATMEEMNAHTLTKVTDSWLTLFSVRAVELLRSIPLESGTRDFQPFLLVALCSELRIVAETGSALTTDLSVDTAGRSCWSDVIDSKIPLSASPTNIAVLRARGLIFSRLNSFLYTLPPRPIQMCLKIVKESWLNMDQAAMKRALRYFQNQGSPETSGHRMHAPAVGTNKLSDHPSSEYEEEEKAVFWMDIMIENRWETSMA